MNRLFNKFLDRRSATRLRFIFSPVVALIPYLLVVNDFKNSDPAFFNYNVVINRDEL